MSGINGYVSSAEAIPNAAELIEGMEAVNWWPNAPQMIKRVQFRRALITNTLTGLWKNLLEQPASDPDGRIHLLLEGQLFNWEEIERAVDEAWARTSCQKLVALFLRDDVDFVERLDGEFNLVIYQPATHRLLIFNDALGSKPFYYLPQPDGLLFGSEKKAMLTLADPQPELDPVGLLQLVAYRHHVGGRTLHKGVYCLPPATYLEFSDDGLRLTRYAYLRFRTRSIPRDLTPLMEEWGELLCKATSRRLENVGSLLLSLSDGLDSRAVACALYRTRSPQLARTLGETTSAEVQSAFAIAKRLGFNHRLEAPGSVPLSTMLPDIVWRTDGAVPFIHGMTLGNHAQLKQQADFMAGGWFGGATSGAHLGTFMLLPYARTQFINRLHTWYRQYHQPAMRALFQPDFVSRHAEELNEVFHASFAPVTAEENWQAFELWDMYERQTRMTFAVAPVDSHLFELVRPFLDTDYLNFGLSLPPYLRYGQIFYQAMIYHLGPEIRHIPNANTGLHLKGTIGGNVLNRVRTRTRRAAARLREKFAPAPHASSLTTRGGLGDEIRQDPALRERIESFMASDFFDPAIFNEGRIQHALNEHDAGMRDHGYAISWLATFAEGLPRLVYQRPQQPHAQPQVAR
jgi:hypothetical protein